MQEDILFMDINEVEDTLTLLHTNDIHSHFENMGAIAAIIAERKQRLGEEQLLVLDIGDHMDRMSIETEGSAGGANIDIINMTGYDAITIGNNEGLTYTPELLHQAYAGISCPIICSNVEEMETGVPPVWMETHRIIQKGTWKIGLIGATAQYSDYYELLGWNVSDPIASLAPWVAKLRSEVDLLVVLSHLGLPTDQKLAEQLPDIDVILGGHSHHVLDRPLWIGSTVLGAAGKFGQYIGEMVWKKDTQGARAHLLDGGLIPITEHMKRDASIENAIVIHRQRAEERMNRTVAMLEAPLEIQYEQESPFGNLLAQAVRQFTGAELSIVNAGQLLADLPAGEVTEGLLHRLCPSPVNPCITLLQGKNIKLALEQSLLPEFTHKTIMGFGFRGKVLGCLCVDGIGISYDLSRPAYDRITAIRLGDQELKDEQEYSVGCLDMFTFGIGYMSLSESNEVKYILPEFIRDLLRMQLQTPGAALTSAEKRWFMV